MDPSTFRIALDGRRLFDQYCSIGCVSTVAHGSTAYFQDAYITAINQSANEYRRLHFENGKSPSNERNASYTNQKAVDDCTDGKNKTTIAMFHILVNVPDIRT